MRRLAVVGLVALVVLTACGKTAAQKAADANASAVSSCRTQAAPLEKILSQIDDKTSGSGYIFSDYAPVVVKASAAADSLQTKVAAGNVTTSCQRNVILYLAKALAAHASADAEWARCDQNPKCPQAKGSALDNDLSTAWINAMGDVSTADSGYDEVTASPKSQVSSVTTAIASAVGKVHETAASQAKAAAAAQAAQEAADAKLAAEQSTIIFKITSTSGAAASVTYNEGDGNIEQDTSARLPWRKTFDDPGSGLMQLSAQNAGGGSITCTIENAAGDVFDQHTSHGPYAIADCQYDEGVQ